MSNVHIEIPDLPVFEAELSAAMVTLPLAVMRADGRLAEAIVAAARGRAAALGSTAGKAAAQLSAQPVPAAAVLDNSVGYALGAERGSDFFRQFKAYNPAGYFLGPSVDEAELGADVVYGLAVEEATTPAFPL